MDYEGFPQRATQAGVPTIQEHLESKGWTRAAPADAEFGPKYVPPNRGAEGQTEIKTLEPGKVIDRFGGTRGSFLADPGTTPGARSLPPGAENRPLHTYEVVKPIEGVGVSRAAPAYGRPGGGVQYNLGKGRYVQDLLDSGHLREIRGK